MTAAMDLCYRISLSASAVLVPEAVPGRFLVSKNGNEM